MAKQKEQNDEEARNNKVETPYFFPEYKLTVKATSLEEAFKKAKAMKHKE
jgi:hypothetical protein